MIFKSAESAIKTLLQAAIDEVVGKGFVPVLTSDEIETKPEMPYVVIQCTEDEEMISPGCGIFKVQGDLLFRSHTKATPAKIKNAVLDAINNFAYDSTAAKLSAVKGFHCHGWHPTIGTMTPNNDAKSTDYLMKYWIYCMAMDNS